MKRKAILTITAFLLAYSVAQAQTQPGVGYRLAPGTLVCGVNSAGLNRTCKPIGLSFEPWGPTGNGPAVWTIPGREEEGKRIYYNRYVEVRNKVAPLRHQPEWVASDSLVVQYDQSEKIGSNVLLVRRQIQSGWEYSVVGYKPSVGQVSTILGPTILDRQAGQRSAGFSALGIQLVAWKWLPSAEEAVAEIIPAPANAGDALPKPIGMNLERESWNEKVLATACEIRKKSNGVANPLNFIGHHNDWKCDPTEQEAKDFAFSHERGDPLYLWFGDTIKCDGNPWGEWLGCGTTTEPAPTTPTGINPQDPGSTNTSSGSVQSSELRFIPNCCPRKSEPCAIPYNPLLDSKQIVSQPWQEVVRTTSGVRKCWLVLAAKPDTPAKEPPPSPQQPNEAAFTVCLKLSVDPATKARALAEITCPD